MDHKTEGSIAKDSVDKSMKFVQLVVISTTGLYLKIKKFRLKG